MTLPTAVRTDALVGRWRCHERGLCCRDWSITTTRPEWVRIRRALKETGDPRAALFDEREVTLSPAGYRVVPSDEAHRCVFLTDENLCGLRMAHGTRPLPSACSKFPFLALMTPNRFLVGISFACPTALGLLAEQSAVEPVDSDPGDLPTETVLNACAADFGDETASDWWNAHAQWVVRYRAVEGTAAERLFALAGLDLAGAPDPDVERFFASCAGDGPAERLLDRLRAASTGADPSTDDLPPSPPEDALLVRYIDHRLSVPTWLAPRYTPDRLWTGLFALLARYALERRRGADPLIALWRVDKLALHGPLLRDLLSTPDLPETLPLTARAALLVGA